MSATMDPAHFIEYFGFNHQHQEIDQFVIHLTHSMTNNARFNIKELYLEDFLDNSENAVQLFEFDKKPKVHDEIFGIAFNIFLQLSPQERQGIVLVFLPGVGQIQTFVSKYNASYKERMDLLLIPLHSKLDEEEETLYRTQKPILNQIKVILATNIAKTSITIPNVTVREYKY
jgi:HrpA-like RNA helicase